jgi:hypothetical protein
MAQQSGQSGIMRFLRHSVTQGLAFSLLLHLTLVGSVELAYRLGWLDDRRLWLGLRERKPDEALKANANREKPPEEVPLVFIDVDPAQASPEPPKEAKYYSSRDSAAANPEPQVDSDVPRIGGTQDQVPKTIDSAQSQPTPLDPAPPPPPETAKSEGNPPEPAPKPAVGQLPGDLALAKPGEKAGSGGSKSAPEKPEPEEPKPARPRPRRLASVRPQRSEIAGEKMRQEGGVRRMAIESSVDARATPFGAYDAAIIAAIQQRWYALLDERSYALNTAGKVVLTFRLNSDGRVTEMRVHENEVSEILAFLCQRAVLDPAPFAPWPSDLRRLVGADHREVRFTFHYN